MRYITDDFLLEGESARRLYFDYAAGEPILDFHNHLPPEEIEANEPFTDLADLWLSHDHYKWRAMRANGVDESFCTGDAPAREKFQRYAESMPYLLGNPLYEWTHLELARFFGIHDMLLGPDTAETIWNRACEVLAQPEMRPREILSRRHVRVACTSDDPTDNLSSHIALRDDPSFDVRVLPTWRPDRGMKIDDVLGFNAWLDDLGAAADLEIASLDDFRSALQCRHDAFHEAGCRLSDHGISTFHASEYTEAEIVTVFSRARAGRAPTGEEAEKFRSAMLFEFAVMDHEKGWTQQYHVGANRNVHSSMLEEVGPDTGFDAMGETECATPLSRLLDRLDREQSLARTVVYNSHPRDNAILLTVLGCFQTDSIPGKMQLGAAWWHLDQRDGIEENLQVQSQMGAIGRFIGMLTDSRSFLSVCRHEYFRRILCTYLGREMDRGRMPTDFDLVGATVRNISYHNADAYFRF